MKSLNTDISFVHFRLYKFYRSSNIFWNILSSVPKEWWGWALHKRPAIFFFFPFYLSGSIFVNLLGQLSVFVFSISLLFSFPLEPLQSTFNLNVQGSSHDQRKLPWSIDTYLFLFPTSMKNYDHRIYYDHRVYVYIIDSEDLAFIY